MGTPDRLREEGLSEEEITKRLADGKIIIKEQDPATARVSHDTEEIVGEAYVPPPSGDGVEDEPSSSPPVPIKNKKASKSGK